MWFEMTELLSRIFFSSSIISLKKKKIIEVQLIYNILFQM